MWTNLKSWAEWVYEWITVLTTGLVGLPSVLLSLLSLIDGIDLSPLLPPEHALKIITFVALAKAGTAYLVQYIEKRRAE